MEDYIIRGMAYDHQVRFFAATTRNLVEESRSIHNTSPVITAALGRLLTAGALMGSMCKNDSDLLTLQIQCQGPVKGLTVTADANGNVKGYANEPVVLLPVSPKGKLDVGRALDLGVLTVIKDIGLKEPYSGQTHLVSGEIAEDLTYYFATSEQTPSSVSLGVLMNVNNTVRQAGGYIIQVMPNVSDETIDLLEQRLTDFPPITSLLNDGKSPEDIMGIIFSDTDYQITDKLPTKYHCNCSKERMKKALASISSKDIQEMIDDGEPIEMSCHFCHTAHSFDLDELKQIIEDRN